MENIYFIHTIDFYNALLQRDQSAKEKREEREKSILWIQVRLQNFFETLE
jgi:hypothetical protein